MSSISEVSFGARAGNAHKLADAVSTFPGYSAPMLSDSVVEYKILLVAVESSNAAVAINTDAYNTAVKNRELIFRKNDVSVIKLLSPIRQAVSAQFSKDSREVKAANNIILRIRNSKIITYKDKDGNDHNISQSEQSYGSLTQLFKDLVNTISNFNGYAPSRAELKIANLTTFAASLETVNKNVNLALLQLNTSRNLRNQHYTDLHDRSQRIKSYVSAQYGIKSPENAAIKGLKI